VTGEGASGGDASGGGVTGEEAAWRDLVARYDMTADEHAGAVPWPDRENLPEPPARERPAEPGPGPRPAGGAGRAGPASGADRTRVIRPATPPRGADPAPGPSAADTPAAGSAAGSAPGAEDEEHYIPPPPPPLPHLDPVAKGAWTALFGGPAYLVLSSIIGWNVPGWAALLAVMAFVGGFAVVVVRLGDGPPRGEGPDNGAVL
jgi:hypothetical protein